MADHSSNGPVELGADMDYAEHERTYIGFLALTKYGTMALIALMIAMAFGFFGGGGFISATILFVIVTAAGSYFLRSV